MATQGRAARCCNSVSRMSRRPSKLRGSKEKFNQPFCSVPQSANKRCKDSQTMTPLPSSGRSKTEPRYFFPIWKVSSQSKCICQGPETKYTLLVSCLSHGERCLLVEVRSLTSDDDTIPPGEKRCIHPHQGQKADRWAFWKVCLPRAPGRSKRYLNRYKQGQRTLEKSSVILSSPKRIERTHEGEQQLPSSAPLQRTRYFRCL